MLIYLLKTQMKRAPATVVSRLIKAVPRLLNSFQQGINVYLSGENHSLADFHGISLVNRLLG